MTMKNIMLFASLFLLAGCADSATDTPAAGAAAGSGTTDIALPAAAATLASYEPGDTSTLAVPEMHCPFACYPKVKKTLEGIDGIASVELVEQAEEGVINDPRVVVTFDGEVNGEDAIAALDSVSFPGSKFESEEN